MNKQEFLAQLCKALSGLPQKDIEERLIFYSEMIDDRMEEGLSEQEAVAAVGTIGEIAGHTAAEIPLAKIAKERIRTKRRMNAFEILLLVLGSPLWLSLLIAAFAVILSVYASLWAVVISLWAVFASLAVCAFALIVAGVFFAVSRGPLAGGAVAGAGIACAGLAIFLFFGCRAAAKGGWILSKKFALWLKSRMMRKEAAR